MKIKQTIPNRNKKCRCWDCSRARGATPRMPEGKMKVTEDNRVQRTIALYAGCAVNEKIPVDADILGSDRPGYATKKRKRRR